MKIIRELIGDTVVEFFKDRDVRKEVKRFANTTIIGTFPPSLGTDTTIDLNGKELYFSQTGYPGGNIAILPNADIYIGDADGDVNSTVIQVFDASKEIDISAPVGTINISSPSGSVNYTADTHTFNGSNYIFLTSTYTSNGLLGMDNTGYVYLGDLDGDVNQTFLAVSDATKEIIYNTLEGTHTFLGKTLNATIFVAPLGTASISMGATNTTGAGNAGNIIATGTDTEGFAAFSAAFNDGETSAIITLSALSGSSSISYAATHHLFTSPHINMSGLQEFANNAAAITGGLEAGDLYYTTSGGKSSVQIVV